MSPYRSPGGFLAQKPQWQIAGVTEAQQKQFEISWEVLSLRVVRRLGSREGATRKTIGAAKKRRQQLFESGRVKKLRVIYCQGRTKREGRRLLFGKQVRIGR
jgi:hypothetical protein